jgi:hypothetical protein
MHHIKYLLDGRKRNTPATASSAGASHMKTPVNVRVRSELLARAQSAQTTDMPTHAA